MSRFQRFLLFVSYFCLINSSKNYCNYEATLLTQEKNLRHCYCKADGTIGKLDISTPACQRLMVSFIPDLRNKDVYSSMTLKCKENIKDFYENPILEKCFCFYSNYHKDNTLYGPCENIVMDDYIDIKEHLIQKCKNKVKSNNRFQCKDSFVGCIIIGVIIIIYCYSYLYTNKKQNVIEIIDDGNFEPK
jgi:hypothetical protein